MDGEAASAAPIDAGDAWQALVDGLASAGRAMAEQVRGAAMAAATAVGRLRARLAMRRWFGEHPDSVGARPVAPVFVIGGWRTGTTLLQRLLDASPGLRGLRPWELGAPWRAARADDGTRARLASGAQAAHDRLHLLNPDLQRVHDSGADLPEECVLALGTSMRNWGFLSTMRLSRYAEWLAGEDLSGEYERYAEMLGILDEGDGRRFVCKAPAHTAELAPLLTAFPDAIVVHLHRAVVETVASGSSLFAVFRSTYSDSVDPLDVGDFQLRTTQQWFDRAMEVRAQRGDPRSGRFVDVLYEDLVRDPIGVARTIHEVAALGWDGTARQVVAGSRGRPVPIIELRVTSAASCSSVKPSVPGGRSGSTM